MRLLPMIAAAMLIAAPVAAQSPQPAADAAPVADAAPSGAIETAPPPPATADPDPRAVLPLTGAPAAADPGTVPVDDTADPLPEGAVPPSVAGAADEAAAVDAVAEAGAADDAADAASGTAPAPSEAASDAAPPSSQSAAETSAGAVPLAAGPQQPAPDSTTQRCTIDRRSCIAVATYVSDVCTVIERASAENRLDPNFLARLLWKESLFEPEAVSPVGAQGIAQFMPDTARMRKLDDPFNPAKAIHASADYLRYLIDGFGNMGMAAVAYNGGERRALNFFNGGTGLPYETQDYVEAITGHNAWKWRDEPPENVDLRLDPAAPFRDACIKLAGNRTLKEFGTKVRAWPWGVILASHPKQSGAQKQVSQLNRALRPILGGKRVSYVRKTMGGSGRKVYTAQVGYSSRGEANAFCTQFRSLGGRCIVLKN